MRIAWATDLSEANEAALTNQTCLECLQRIGVEAIDLITVIPSNVHSGIPGVDIERDYRRQLEGYAAMLEGEGFGVSMHAVRGTPHRRINGIAETVGASMIVIGSRGQSPLRNRLIGSTARNLSRSTTVPLLVSRIQRERAHPDPTRAHLFRRTMFATDFSDNAAAAFSHFEYLRHATREATLVHVQTPRGESLDPEPEAVLADLEELAEPLREWGIDTTVDVRTGDPATELLAAEEAHDPTMTLVGSRGRSRLRRLLLGAVSERLLTEAQGNVLLVPPPGR